MELRIMHARFDKVLFIDGFTVDVLAPVERDGTYATIQQMRFEGQEQVDEYVGEFDLRSVAIFIKPS